MKGVTDSEGDELHAADEVSYWLLLMMMKSDSPKCESALPFGEALRVNYESYSYAFGGGGCGLEYVSGVGGCD
jgi:hypothetical protein